MKLFAKLSLALFMSLSFNQVSVAERWESGDLEDGDEFFEDGTTTRGCKRVKCLVVCGNASVGGTLSVSGSETVGSNLSVGGTVTGSAFAVSPAAAVGTPGVPGIGGMLAWGEVGRNISAAAPAAAAPFVFDYVNTAPAESSDITWNTTDGLVLANPGVYMFQYSATTVLPTVAGSQTVTVNLTNNATAITNSQFTAVADNTTGATSTLTVNGFIIAYIPLAASVIRMTLVASTSTFAYPAAPNVGAKLTAIRLS